MKNLKQGGEKRQFNKSFFITVQYLPSTLSARDDKNSGRVLVPNNNYKKQTKFKTLLPFTLQQLAERRRSTLLKK